MGGSRGRQWAQAYVDRRFVESADKAAIGEYLYQTAVMDGSGEYALQKVLGNFIFARHPLAHRLRDLKCACEELCLLACMARPLMARCVQGAGTLSIRIPGAGSSL